MIFKNHRSPAIDYLQCGIQRVFIRFQVNDIVVNFQGNTFIQRTYIYSQKIYSSKDIVFIQGIIYQYQENYSHSRKL